MSSVVSVPPRASIEVGLAGEIVRLLAARAVFWPAAETLFISDPHFGKSATFRRFGMAAPDETAGDLEKLGALLKTTGAKRLVVLGDFFHARLGRSDSILNHLRHWRRQWDRLKIVLVRGNHDKGAGDPPGDWNIECVSDGWRCGPFVCCHEPCDHAAGYVLAGHIHPGFALSENNGGRLRMACFVIGSRRAILPAFGAFTGLAIQPSRPEEEIYGVHADEIVKVKGRSIAMSAA